MSVPLDEHAKKGRADITRQQVALLRKYGHAGISGLAALDMFREVLLRVSTETDERFENGFFTYSKGPVRICFVNWHRSGLQIIFPAERFPMVFEIDGSSAADWDGIRMELIRRLRD